MMTHVLARLGVIVDRASRNRHRPRTCARTTEQAVRDFQRIAGLDADGLVGSHTWSTLAGQQPGWELDSNGIIDPDEIGRD
jgi:murein L,D-transpeptidase YcbB/YkuD